MCETTSLGGFTHFKYMYMRLYWKVGWFRCKGTDCWFIIAQIKLKPQGMNYIYCDIWKLYNVLIFLELITVAVY